MFDYGMWTHIGQQRRYDQKELISQWSGESCLQTYVSFLYTKNEEKAGINFRRRNHLEILEL